MATAQNGDFTLWQPATGEARVLHAADEWVCALAWAPDGSRLAAAQMCVMSGAMMGEACPYGDKHPMVVVDTQTGDCRAVPGHFGWVHALAFSPDGGGLAAAAGCRAKRCRG